MPQLKLGLLIALVLVTTIVVVQNTDVVRVRLLVWELEMSRIVLIMAPFLAGCAAGALLASLVRKRTARSVAPAPRPPEALR